MTKKNVKKTFVLDTNVLLHDPKSMFSFEENDVVVPIYVVEEIDNFKKDMSELGRNARQVSRNLDDLRQKGHSLAKGVELPTGGTLFVAVTANCLPPELTSDRGQDSKILATALEIQKNKEAGTVIFVTKDSNLRIRADAMGMAAEDHEADKIVDLDAMYSGFRKIEVTADKVDMLYSKGGLVLPEQANPLVANEYVNLADAGNDSHAGLGRVVELNDGFATIEAIARAKDGVFGMRPRNVEQNCALDALMDPEVKLVTLVGIAGTGKTLCATAAGLAQSTDTQEYQKVLISRPVMPLGKDIGYLPGTVEEKMDPYMQPIYDNLEFLMGLTKEDKQKGRSYKEMIDMGMVQVEPLTYIRGRSIPEQFMIVDECQNLSPHEIKTIISRAGEGTKIVLTGDPEQIDNPYVDATNNGLTYVVERFKGQKIAATITLRKGERSELADLAAKLL